MITILNENFYTKDDPYIKELVSKLNTLKIGHAGYPETYGECFVNLYGKRQKGSFTGYYQNGTEFRVRTKTPYGGYEERNYPVEEIEFIE